MSTLTRGETASSLAAPIDIQAWFNFEEEGLSEPNLINISPSAVQAQDTNEEQLICMNSSESKIKLKDLYKQIVFEAYNAIKLCPSFLHAHLKPATHLSESKMQD